MPEQTPLVNVQIDGVWHQFPKGMRLIEACVQVGLHSALLLPSETELTRKLPDVSD